MHGIIQNLYIIFVPYQPQGLVCMYYFGPTVAYLLKMKQSQAFVKGQCNRLICIFPNRPAGTQFQRAFLLNLVNVLINI